MNMDSKHSSSSPDLRHLALRLSRGEAEAIEQIYRCYFYRLLHYGIQVAGSEHKQEVEDVIQEFFIWLARNDAKAADISNLESYMFYSIRRNIQSRLNEKKENRAAHERYISRTFPLVESSNHSPEQLHIQQEESESMKRIIRQELDQLPHYMREALYLRYFENKSYKEIAAILEVGDQVAYNYVFRAIKRLKKQFIDLKLLLAVLFGIIKMLFY